MSGGTGRAVQWHKSTYSSTNGGNCLEAGRGLPGAVPVRDSKLSDSPVLSFPSAGWGKFLATVKDGRFSA
ncbi:DUF397 domain-containing protein [Streptomyces lonarensis]|uniref:DUF397 domain-containing protein n=1 Tax=Streptomyces lonarensis TaxID=700599 RepID=A0A7X6CYI2_9ACTN|nr:DUF397 domain-containing protein [Streptomyces lonarensis]NJQ04897.1 DUF397 domain-containing protein [Streptomyces lonarensis]